MRLHKWFGLLMVVGALAAGHSQAQTASARPCATPDAPGYFPAQNPQRRSVIVFVHGVMGSPITTWLNSPVLGKDVFWPCLMDAHPAFAATNMYLAGYPSSPTSSAPTIDQAAQMLFRDLESAGVLRNHTHVGFAVHSLGGLIVSRMILNNAADPLVRRIRFVHFYGTPGSGSGWAELGAAFSANLTFSEMRDAERLDHWAQQWRRQSRDMGIRSFCAVERKGLGWPIAGEPVVSAASAALLCGGDHDNVWLDHLEMVKPRSVQDTAHKLLVNSFNKCVSPHLHAAAINQVSTPEGQAAGQWFRQFQDRFAQARGQSLDMVQTVKQSLFALGTRYVSPQAGRPSLAERDNELLDANSFSNEFRSQLEQRLERLEIDQIFSVGNLGEAMADSDGYELARRLVANGFNATDLVLATKLRADSSAPRVLIFLAKESGTASAEARLRGFAFLSHQAACL